MLTLRGVFEDCFHHLCRNKSTKRLWFLSIDQYRLRYCCTGEKKCTKRLWFLSIDQYRLRYCCTGEKKMLILDGVFEDCEYDIRIFTAM